jgi:hypothetical protein
MKRPARGAARAVTTIVHAKNFGCSEFSLGIHAPGANYPRHSSPRLFSNER